MIVLVYMIHNTLFQYRSTKMFEALCRRSLIILGSFLFGQYLNMTLLLQETLLRRTCKLVEFENASKSLEKAKPKNQEQVCFCFCKFLFVVCNIDRGTLNREQASSLYKISVKCFVYLSPESPKQPFSKPPALLRKFVSVFLQG